MWIAHLSIGHKKIAGLLLVSIVVIIATHQTKYAFVALTALAATWIGLLYLAYYLGIYIRKTKFTIKNKHHEVIDYYFPRSTFENKRYIRVADDRMIISEIYTRPQERWAYFDMIRTIIKQVSPTGRHNALILGAVGGGTGRLLQQCCGFTRVEMVEMSRQMIRVAESYFLPHPHPGIFLYHANALSYVRDTKKQYDLIFVDIFQAGDVDVHVFSKKFLQKLPRLLTARGVLLINFGFPLLAKPKNITQALPHATLCLYGKNLIGIWSRNSRYIKHITNSNTLFVIPST